MIIALLTTMGFFFLSFQMFSVHLLSQEHRHSSLFSSSSRRRKNGVFPPAGILSNGHEKDPEQMRHFQNQFLDKYLEELQREEGWSYRAGEPGRHPIFILAVFATAMFPT